MKNETGFVITDDDLERMQVEVDEAIRLMEEEQMDAAEENQERIKSA